MSKFKKTINGKEYDISSMIQPGNTNSIVVNAFGVNFPAGTSDTAWSRPNPFGYTIQNVDISQYYTAKYLDFNSPSNGSLPDGVNHIKVICIGGGGGGQGGGGGYTKSTTTPGTFVESNMNPGNKNPGNDDSYNQFGFTINYRNAPTYNFPTYNIGFDNQPTTNYGPDYGGNNGYSGGNGAYASYDIDATNIQKNYSITIGGGGGGGSGSNGNDANYGSVGSDGGSGNSTNLSISGSNYNANGGSGGSSYAQSVSHPTDRPAISSGNAGGGGGGGYSMNGAGSRGSDGSSGYCRVYFLY
jgi:hypothetical protein